jgi:phage terminase large subunit-like protein
MSHDADEPARVRLQGYVANYVWLDEMPRNIKLVSELQTRVQSLDGRFIATFTPTSRNDEIKNMVDSADGVYSKRYNIAMMDNPILVGNEKKRHQVESRMAGLPEGMRRMQLYGEWYGGEGTVFHLDYEKTVIKMPAGYHPGWSHILAVDPAISSKMGYIFLANQPNTPNWIVVRSGYIQGVYVPSKIVEAMEEIACRYNIVKRISDTEPWFLETARDMKIIYAPVQEKVHRKEQLISDLQENLGTRILILEDQAELLRELNMCHWSEVNSGAIAARRKWHLLDALQYGNDILPKYTAPPIEKSWHQELRETNLKIKTARAAKEKSSRLRLTRSRRWT